MALSPRDITIQDARLSYAHLFTPHAPNDQADPKYSVTILIPKDSPQLTAIQQAIQAAVTDGVDRGTFKQPIDPMATKYPPLRDGDQPNDSGEARGAEFAGHYFIAAKSNTTRPPFIVGPNMAKIIDETEVYSGCYANVAIQFFAYSNSGNRGVTASLVGVQKVRDGERLGGPALEAADVFQALSNPAPNASNDPWGSSPAGDTGLGF